MLLRSALLLLLVAASSPALADATIRLPGAPAVSPNGKRIAFAWNGDLWSARIRGGVARRLTAHDATESQPVYSPDGKQIAFTSNRSGSTQVYLMPAGGGEAKPVTTHTEGYQVHAWFPDGQSLLCTGNRDHHWRDASRMLRVWIDGSRGEQVLTDAAATAPSLSPDGKQILYNREGKRWWRKGYRGAKAAQVWLFDLESGKHRELLHETSDCYWPVWKHDGSGFYFSMGGSEGFDLYEAAVPTEDDKLATPKLALDVETHAAVFPAVAANAPVVVYRHGFNLYRWDTEAAPSAKRIKLRARGDDVQREDIARRKLDRASDVAFHPDGLEIAVIAGGDVWVMDTELREPVQVTRTPEYETSLTWGPKGDALWFVSSQGTQADIFKAERADKDKYWWRSTEFNVTQITDDAPTESRLRLDPTGKRLMYVRGNGELWSRELDGGKTTKLVDGFDPPDYDVSPDGRWLAYSHEDNDFNSDVFLMPMDKSQPPVNVSRHPDNDSHPRFSHDGKVLAFTGRRFETETDIFYVYLQDEQNEETSRQRKLKKAIAKFKKERKQQKPQGKDQAEKKEGDKKKDDKSPKSNEIDLEGIDQRLRRISIPGVDERGLVWISEGQRLAFEATIKGRRGYYTVEMPNKLSPKFLSSTTGFGAVWSKKSKSLRMNAGGRPTTLSTSGKVNGYSFSVLQEYSRSKRYAHAFDVAWRTMRDRWYDERLGGKNWDQVRRRYRRMAARSIDNQSFGTVVQMMLGELNGSHLGFYPSRNEKRYSAPSHTDRTAHLGLRFDPSHKGPGLKVRDSLPNGPTDKADISIAPGDLLLAIDGKAVDPAMDLTAALNGQPSRDVRLKIKKPDADQPVEYVVRPISYASARELLYKKWLEDCRTRVEQQSEGKLGYLHIRKMNMPSFTEFERQLHAAGHGKAGLVIDVRDNGGGWTSDILLTCLTQPRHAITVPRDGGQGYPHDRRVFATWHKPIIVLCNQNSFSNAEIFSHAIKTLGRGKVVGVPTGGGVISTGSTSVIDMGRMRMPFRGWFVIGTGQDMELNGAVPHVVIWPKPGELPQGIDQQLKRAVGMLLEEVKQQPEGPTLKYVTEGAQNKG